MPARAGEAPHIDDEFDARAAEQAEKPINGMSGVPYGQQLPPRNQGALHLSLSPTSPVIVNQQRSKQTPTRRTALVKPARHGARAPERLTEARSREGLAPPTDRLDMAPRPLLGCTHHAG